MCTSTRDVKVLKGEQHWLQKIKMDEKVKSYKSESLTNLFMIHDHQTAPTPLSIPSAPQKTPKNVFVDYFWQMQISPNLSKLKFTL